MIVVTRLAAAPDERDGVLEQCRVAVAALTAQPGCRSATVGGSIDDPGLWVLVTVWESVGAYRRALSSYDVKLNAVPLLYRAVDEPSAYEQLLTWTPEHGQAEHASDRADVPEKSDRAGR